MENKFIRADDVAQELSVSKPYAYKLIRKLNSYLADIDEQAEELFSRLVKQIAEREGVTEQLKAGNQLEWVQKMNSIRNRAVEIVNTELIYM